MCSTMTVAQIDSAAADTVAGKKSALTRFLDYFNDANKNKQHKKFDFSVIRRTTLQHGHQTRRRTCSRRTLPYLESRLAVATV